MKMNKRNLIIHILLAMFTTRFISFVPTRKNTLNNVKKSNGFFLHTIRI